MGDRNAAGGTLSRTNRRRGDLERSRLYPSGEDLDLLWRHALRDDAAAHRFGESRDHRGMPVGRRLESIKRANESSVRKHAEVDGGVGLQIGYMQHIAHAP